MLERRLISTTPGCLVMTIVPNAVRATASLNLFGTSPEVYTSSALAAATNTAGRQSAARVAVLMLLVALLMLGLALTFALHRRQPAPALP